MCAASLASFALVAPVRVAADDPGAQGSVDTFRVHMQPPGAEVVRPAGVDSGDSGAILYVDAGDSGAEVYLDGAMVGRSPRNLKGVPAGFHRVEARLGDYQAGMDVMLQSDDVRRVDLVLELRTGAVKVLTDPPGAVVRLDSIEIPGMTPLKAERIPMGPHRLFVSLPGHIPQVCSLVVRPDETLTRELGLLPGARVSISSDGEVQGVFRRDTFEVVRQAIPGSMWLGTGRWILETEANRAWAPWKGELVVDTAPAIWRVDLLHSKEWNDSVAAAHRRRAVLGWRWASGVATLVAAGGAVFCHVEASQARDDADQAASDYDATVPGGDFAAAKARHESARDDYETWSRGAVLLDIGTGVLASGFLLAFAF